MLVLFELSSGYAVFNVNDDGAIKDPDASWKIFDSQKSIKKNITVEAMHKFKSMTDAVTSLNTVIEGKLSDDLSKFLGDIIEKNPNNVLAVADAKLGAEISKKLGVQVVADKSVINLYRGLREQLENILPDSKELLSAMSLGLSHSLSRHKLKFSIDKVDTMIIHSSGLLEDLDKEINTYAMRAKEWYGLHFPEMSKIVEDNLAYAKVIKTIGFRSDAQSSDLSSILPEELEIQVKEAAEVSMGSEISQDDLESISQFCDQIINLSEYRAQLHEYIRNRMKMMTPNLTTLVGELIGAKLISHAGGLTNLAKLPASTVQILGAEKAFFRAVKAKKSTPKYGILYHASLVGQASAKNKGKIARLVATKSSLSARADSFSEEKDVDAEMGNKSRKFIEKRLNILEKTKDISSSTTKKKNSKMQGLISTVTSYNPSADIVKASIQPMEICEESDKSEESEKIVKMDIVEETQDVEKPKKNDKKRKKDKGESKADEQEESAEIKGSTKDKKKDKKIKKEKKKFKANEQEEPIKSKSLSKKGKEKSKTDEQEEPDKAKSSSKKGKEKSETGEQEGEPVKAKSSGKKNKEKPETGEQEEEPAKAKSSSKKSKEKPETSEQVEEPVKTKSSSKKSKEKSETGEQEEEPVKAKSSSKKGKEKPETSEQKEEPVKAKSSSKKSKEKSETGEQEEEPVKTKSSSKKGKEKSETGEREEEPVKAKSSSKKNKEKSKADEQEESAKVKSSNKKRKAKSRADEQEESVEDKSSSKKRKEEFDIQEESSESKPSSKKGKEKSKNDEQEESVKSSSKKDKEESKSSSKKDKSGKVKTEKKESVQIADVEEHGETSKSPEKSKKKDKKDKKDKKESKATKRKHDASDDGKDNGKDEKEHDPKRKKKKSKE